MSNINRKDVMESQHKLHNDVREEKEDKSADNAYYTMFGKQQYLDELGFPRLIDDEIESVVFAKKLWNPANTAFKYFVRQENGRLYNPNPIIPAAKTDKVRRHTSQSDFMQVSPSVFKMYLQYLKTKNQAHYTNANRALM